jgi:hypothetical protein
VFNNSLITYHPSNSWNCCPKTNCTGKVIEVDELMLPIILTLWNKGYYTSYCCSGHIYDNYPNTYIKFESEVDIPYCPIAFAFEEENVIRKFYKTTDYALFYEILDVIKILQEWALQLPINPRTEELKEIYT